MITATTARENTNTAVPETQEKVLSNIYAAIEDHSKKGGNTFEFGVNGLDPQIIEHITTDLTTNGFSVAAKGNESVMSVIW